MRGPARSRLLDLDRLVQVRLERLAHKAVEPHHAGRKVVRARLVEPRQHAAPALGAIRTVAPAATPSSASARESADREPRRVGKLVARWSTLAWT